jgi:hypothetical protein
VDCRKVEIPGWSISWTYCITRAPRCRSFKGSAAYGYCAAKKQTYYGFHGHLLVSASGVISGFSLTPANGSEREALWDLVEPIRGLLIGDKGYLSATLQQELSHVGIRLETAVRSNMSEHRSPADLKLLTRVRRLVETVIGQLVAKLQMSLPSNYATSSASSASIAARACRSNSCKRCN